MFFSKALDMFLLDDPTSDNAQSKDLVKRHKLINDFFNTWTVFITDCANIIHY